MPDRVHAVATVWFTPLRVNLRYTPSLARVRLSGKLLAPHTTELLRILAVLDQLPAPVQVDLSAVDEVDGDGLQVLTDERSRRLARGAPPLVIGIPGRFVDTLPRDATRSG